MYNWFADSLKENELLLKTSLRWFFFLVSISCQIEENIGDLEMIESLKLGKI